MIIHEFKKKYFINFNIIFLIKIKKNKIKYKLN